MMFSLGRGQKDLLEATIVVPLLSGGKSWGVDWDGSLDGEVLAMASDNRVWGSVLPSLGLLPAGWTACRADLSGSLLRPVLQVDAGVDWVLAGGPEFIEEIFNSGMKRENSPAGEEDRQAGRPVAHWVGSAATGLEDLVSWWAQGGERPPVESMDFWWSDGQVRVLSKAMDLGAIRPLMPFSIPLEESVVGIASCGGQSLFPSDQCGSESVPGSVGRGPYSGGDVVIEPGQ